MLAANFGPSYVISVRYYIINKFLRTWTIFRYNLGNKDLSMKLAIHSILAIVCLLMADISFADEFASQRDECNNDTTKTKRWDNKLNRCMTTAKAKKIRTKTLGEYKNCTLHEKKADRDKCMHDLVVKVSGNVKLEDTNWDALLMDSISLGISVSNLNFTTVKPTPCFSLKMGATCGGMAILKTLYIMYQANKETKDNYKEFEEKVADKENYDTQILAYDTQINQLKSLAKYYEQKRKLTNIVAGCYVATAAMAIYEAGTLDPSVKTCKANAEQPATSGDKQAYEKAETGGLVEGNPGLTSQMKSLWAKADQFLQTPMGIATLSLTNTAWNLIKANKLKEQGEKADLLAKRAEIIRDQFKTTMEKYCPNGHDDKNNLMCYCYENGEKKSNRTNSDSCKTLWANNERNLFAESSDKTAATGTDIAKPGCITEVGKFDPTCQCRNFKDEQGNNACRKTSFSTVQLAGLGQVMDIEQLESDLNNVTNGLTAAQGFDLTPAQTSALSGNVRDQLISQIQVEDKNGLRQATSEDMAAVQKSLLSGVTRELAKSPASGNAFDKELAKIQEKVEGNLNNKKSVAEIKKLKMTGGKGQSLNNNKKKNFALNLGGSSRNVEQYPEYMQKKYKTKNADVVTNKEASIFKILSNRYYKSGFKRLFDQ